MIVNAADYLKERQAQSSPELINQWEEMEQLHTNKYIICHVITTIVLYVYNIIYKPPHKNME